MKRSVIISFVIMLSFFCNVAGADIDDPHIFYRGTQSYAASFHIDLSTNSKNTLELGIDPDSSVNYRFLFSLQGAKSSDIFSDTSEVVKSLEGHYDYKRDKDDFYGINETFTFRTPEKGKSLHYVLYAEIERSPSLISGHIASIEAPIDVYNVDGVIYVFIRKIKGVE